VENGTGAARPSRRTIYDVAEHAGVSLATVSRYLNGSGYVGARSRVRIEAAISALDYVPSQPARALGGRGSGLVVLGVRHISNPRWPEVALVMEDLLQARGLSLVLMSIGIDRERELAALDRALRLRADGFAVAMAHFEPGDFDRLRAAGTQVVSLAGYIADGGIDAVYPDRPRAVELAVEHLASLGHQRIALFDSTANQRAMGGRVMAHADALERAGLAYDDRLVLDVDLATLTAAEDVAARVRAAGATAVVAVGDVLAIGLWLGLERLGLRVPEDVSIIGMDDIEAAVAVRGGLTTIAFDRYEQSRLVVELLLARMDGAGPSEPVHRRLEPRLVVRASTAPPSVAVASAASHQRGGALVSNNS
jgi:LacI family transcriptional regulator